MPKPALFIVSSDATAIAHFKRPDTPKIEKPPKKPKDRLAWLLARHHIQPEHADLGERILKLAETKQREPVPHMHFDHGSGGGGGTGGALGRVSARQKWDRLFSIVGETGRNLVTTIIIEGKSLADAAEALNMHPKAVLPMLQYTLDIMART